jgi:SAM-dependent methyltransferase
VSGGNYERDRFVRDPEDVRIPDYELEEIGDVTGKSLLHLQCHFGLDTLSFARLGADVTGADFSPRAIDEAQRLASDCGLDARFVLSDLYDLPRNLDERFDVVYTSRGVIGWLPDIRRWAEVVAHFVRPGGRFYILEAHPTFWVFENEDEPEPVVAYPYFDRPEPITLPVQGSYADRDAELESTVEHGWAHGLGEVVNALIDQGLVIRSLREYPFLEWSASFLVEGEDGRWRMPPDARGEIPLMFSLLATK